MSQNSQVNEQITKVKTKNKVRFSFCNVFTPKAMPGEDPETAKYSVQILIPKSDTVVVEQFNKAIEAAKQLGVTSKWGGKLPGGLKAGLRDGDAEFPNDPNYKNMWFINANNKQRPGIVSEMRDEFGKRLVIGDPVDFYSGCWGWVSVNFFPFKNKSNGVACSLNNIMKAESAPLGQISGRLGGGASADEDFDEFATGDDDFMK